LKNICLNDKAPPSRGSPRANTLGLHRFVFAVDGIEDTLARLRPHGAELVGEVTRYEDSYLLRLRRHYDGPTRGRTPR